MVSDWTRCRLDEQGFMDVEDKTVARWLKFSPLMCAIGFGAGTYLQSPLVLYLMGLMAVAGLTFHKTIFDWFYDAVIARVIDGPQLPDRPAPARFACFIAVIWSAFTASAFLVGYTTAGYVLGAGLTFAAGLLGTVNYCIASVLWRKLYGWPDR
ncbi:MAG: DUF4395 domain-containing protein [Candidatus Nanohaloarchaeota archaeon QJJ-5]|nr:DUF4395 domain-containing protein [Candidatus Nanohaloarchaeota archaeon QJJ-5]